MVNATVERQQAHFNKGERIHGTSYSRSAEHRKDDQLSNCFSTFALINISY